MTRRGAILLLAALALPLASCDAPVEHEVEIGEVAPPEGPVVDGAAIIPADAEAELDRRLRDFWDEEETAIVVSTTDSLGGRSIEHYARDEFNGWGIGGAETHRGVLVLVAPNEREARIEVGCGLETVLTNEAAQVVMDEAMIPHFRQADFPQGIAAAVEAIIAALEESETMPGPVTPYCVELMREAA